MKLINRVRGCLVITALLSSCFWLISPQNAHAAPQTDIKLAGLFNSGGQVFADVAITGPYVRDLVANVYVNGNFKKQYRKYCSVDSGEEFFVSFPAYSLERGTTSVKVILDPQFLVNEINEDNNQLLQSFTHNPPASDLVITEMTTIGGAEEVFFVVKNKGPVPVDGDLRFSWMVNEVPKPNITKNVSLKQGEDVQFSTGYTLRPGPNVINIKADSNNVYEESDEDNNWKQIEFYPHTKDCELTHDIFIGMDGSGKIVTDNHRHAIVTPNMVKKISANNYHIELRTLVRRLGANAPGPYTLWFFIANPEENWIPSGDRHEYNYSSSYVKVDRRVSAVKIPKTWLKNGTTTTVYVYLFTGHNIGWRVSNHLESLINEYDFTIEYQGF